VTIDPAELTPADRDALLLWRLALGPAAESGAPHMALAGLCPGARLGGGGGAGAADGGLGLTAPRAGELDEALDFVYGLGGEGGGPSSGPGGKRGGAGRSSPYVPRWLASLREFFSRDIVAFVQRDAIERRDLTQLLFEPETLPLLERDVELVATLVSMRALVPDTALEAARKIVREVVDELRKKLETHVRTAVLGALRRSERSPFKLLRNLDWRRTIRSNLTGWDRARKRLIPERLHFSANQRRRHEWDVVLVVDQSGSMAESVVYSAVMAAIFASLDVLRTRLVFFDTTVVDMTPALTDPVEVLFSTQLGGGTDIHQAVAYAQERLIERPEKTLFLLVTDLFEGGSRDGVVARMRALVESHVKALCLLALTDGGRPSYDHDLAADLEAVGVRCFGCTPDLLVRVMERVLRGDDLGPLAAEPPSR